MADKHIEYLGCDIKTVVSESHKFGTDAILLADFASPKANENACDLGTGCGIIPLLWCRNGQAAHITAVEIQKQAYEQAVESVKISSMQDKIDVINDDLKNIKNVLPHASMNVVAANPPYKANGCGIVSVSDAEKIARHETECNLNDVASAAAYILKFGGRLCVCNRPERLCDTVCAMKQAGIEPKRLRLVVKNSESKPWLFLMEGRKGGKPFMSVEPMLIMYKADGEYSDEVAKIYGNYKENSR